MDLRSTNDTTPTDLEQLLAEAGFSFSVVDRCPDEGCADCAPGILAAAA